jgi:peptidoglycan/LPS O-acetylase OafA/YrhL
VLVVLSHMPWPIHFEMMGHTGVGVFFVLSGFLMGHLYGAAEWTPRAVARYAIARFARIAPIYWLVITVCVVISYTHPADDFVLRIEGVRALARHYMFAGNVHIFWSIPLEVQYYVFFLLVWWALSQRSHRVYALPLLALLCAAMVVTQSHWPGLALPSKLHFFLAGTLAGLLPRPQWVGTGDRRVLAVLQASAAVLLLLPLLQYSSNVDFYASEALGLSLATAIYLLSVPSRWTEMVFATPWMRKIGQASFSIYLMHVLVFHYGASLLGLHHTVYEPLWLLLGAAGVALPMVVSHWIEMPLQRHTRRWLQGRLDRTPLTFKTRSTPA